MLPINTKLKLSTKSPYLGWRLLSIGLMGSMVGCILLSGYFIYDSIYRTLEDVNSIVVLDSTVQLSSVNEAAYQKAHDLVDLKTSTTTIPSNLRNVFIPIVAPTTTLKK